jgi:hypothetical protein
MLDRDLAESDRVHSTMQAPTKKDLFFPAKHFLGSRMTQIPGSNFRPFLFLFYLEPMAVI